MMTPKLAPRPATCPGMLWAASRWRMPSLNCSVVSKNDRTWDSSDRMFNVASPAARTWMVPLKVPEWKTLPPLDDGDVRSRSCLLYTSDAADEEDSVDLGGRRIIK